MPSPTPAAPTLATVYPDAIKYGPKRVRVGIVACKLARLVLRGDGAARVADLALNVWGAPRVPRTRLAEVLNRLNRKLAEVDCPLRLSREEGRVLLL